MQTAATKQRGKRQMRQVLRPPEGEKQEMEETLLTSEEVASILRMTTRFVRRLVQERRIEHVKVGRSVRFTPEAVADFKARNTRRAMTRSELRRELAGV